MNLRMSEAICQPCLPKPIKVDKSDVEKGVDSDNAANELCDLVEDIVERVPYLRVLVSMLTPRFDLQVSWFVSVICGYSDTFPMGLNCSRT